MNGHRTLALAAALLATTAPATAGQTARTESFMAPAACVGSQPDDVIRHRVGGMRNAGPTTIYAICAMFGDPGTTGLNVKQYVAGIVLRNTGGTTATVNCTLHGGRSVSSVATVQGSVVYTASIGPGGSLDWSPSYFEMPKGEHFAHSTFICKLPPKMEVSHLNRSWFEEVGA